MKSTLSILLAIGLITAWYSCSKEPERIIHNSKGVLNVRSNSIDSNVLIFSLGLSRALTMEDSLRLFIKDKSNPNCNDCGYNDLLLNCIKGEQVTPSKTFEEILIPYMNIYCPDNIIVENIITYILNNFPSVSLKIPDKFLYVNWNPQDLGQTPAIVFYTTDETIVCYNGGIISPNSIIDENSTTFYLNFSVSEFTVALDNQGNINNSSLNISQLLGGLTPECETALSDYFDEVGAENSCLVTPTNKLVSIDSIYAIVNECNEPTIIPPSDPIIESPPPPLCLTTPLRDVDDNHYTWNYFDGFKVPLDQIPYINNQPGGEDKFSFVFVWVHAKNGAASEHEWHVNVPAFKLVKPAVYHWDLSDCDDDDILAGDTDDCAKLTVESAKESLYYKTEDRNEFFHFKDSRWYLDDEGKFFTLSIVEFDETTKQLSTNSTNGSSTTHTTNIGITVPFYEKVKANGGYTYKYTSSRSISTSVTIKGASIVPIGKHPIDWCDQESQFLTYPWGTIMLLTTGCDVRSY